MKMVDYRAANKLFTEYRSRKNVMGADPSTRKVTEFPIKTRIPGAVSHEFYLRMIDTPGGNTLAHHKTVDDFSEQAIEYIRVKLQLHINEEDRIKQEWVENDPVTCKNHLERIRDNRVHLVFYFFTANRCKPTEMAFLAKLCPLVNVIPIISMADQYSSTEMTAFKSKICNIGVRFFNVDQALKSIVPGQKMRFNLHQGLV